MKTAIQSSAINNTNYETGEFKIKTSAHAFKILSSSLYEDKHLAVMREIACNALDAHIDAGIPEVPIEIILPNDLDSVITFIDHGKGMSLEILQKLYTTYFDSTKNESDEQIGGFGLGSKSPFSLTDNFTVISVTEEGEETTIYCYLDRGVPKVTVISNIQDSTKPNGTTIKISVKEKDIRQLADTIHRTGIFDYWEVRPTINARDPYFKNEIATRFEKHGYTRKYTTLDSKTKYYIESLVC